jgi:hypothetical protein
MGSLSNTFYSNSFTKKQSFCYNSLRWIDHQSGESSNLCKWKNPIQFLDSAQFGVRFWPSVCPAAEVVVTLIKHYFFCEFCTKGMSMMSVLYWHHVATCYQHQHCKREKVCGGKPLLQFIIKYGVKVTCHSMSKNAQAV